MERERRHERGRNACGESVGTADHGDCPGAGGVSHGFEEGRVSEETTEHASIVAEEEEEGAAEEFD